MAYGYVYPGYVSLAIVVIFAMVTRRVAEKAVPRSRLPPRIGGAWKSWSLPDWDNKEAYDERFSAANHAGEIPQQLPLRHAQMPEYSYSRDGEAGVLRGGRERRRLRRARGSGPKQLESASSGKMHPSAAASLHDRWICTRTCLRKILHITE